MSYKTIALALGLTRVLNASAEASVVFNIPEGETQCPTAGEFAELAGRTVVKRGAGRLVMTDTAAKDVDLVYEDGSLAFTRTLPETVTVSPDDGLWHYAGTDSSGGTVSHTPYAGTDGIYAGFADKRNNLATVTVRTMPVALVGRMKISGTVRMSGSGSWGFALVLHNDPRGAEARADWAGTDALGYASGNPIRNSFAVGFVNHYSEIGSYRIGADGAWVEKATTDPLIYFNPYDAATQQTAVREFGLVLESDAAAQTVTLTLTQDQDGSPVVFTRTWAGVDLVSLCGGETAYLAFTTDSGGRTTEATIENLRVAYSPDSRVDVLTDGAGALPNQAILALDAVNFVIDRADKFDASTSVDLVRGATLKVMNGVEHRFLRGVIEGVRQTPGTYSASDCDWVTGEGSVRLDRAGCFFIIR